MGGDAFDRYLWDEPWTGNNRPRPTTETIRTEDDETATRTTETPTAEYGTAVPISLTRTSSKAVIHSSPRKSGGAQSVNVAQTRGFGILPDTSTADGTEELDDESDDMNLIIQGNQHSKADNNTNQSFHSRSLGLPSITPMKTPSSSHTQWQTLSRSQSQPQSQQSQRASWVDFDFDIPLENESRKKPESMKGGKKTFSWLDDVSRDSFASDEVDGDAGRERVRSWKLGRRVDEMGWDGAI